MKKNKNFKASEYMKRPLFKVSYIASVLIIAVSALFLSGCKEKSYFDSRESSIEISENNSKASGKGGKAEDNDENTAQTDDENANQAADGKNKEAYEDSSKEDSGKSSEDNTPVTIYVQVEGAVNSPGVFEMNEGDRIYMALEKAGGLTESADVSSINQAAMLSDGDFIMVYTKEEIEKQKKEGSLAEASGIKARTGFEKSDTGLSGEGLSQSGISSGSSDNGLININTASKEALMTLPGIGESKADLIINYRTENGAFAKPEDIKNINGIKDGVFSKIKDKITV